jgi:gamma-glutamyltranspeptidase/glutathione hydrolase
MRDARAEVVKDLKDVPNARSRFGPLFSQYLDSIDDASRFQSPLVAVLERIAADGPAGFYDGAVGAAIVGTVRGQGGVITAEDLQRMQPVVREPLSGTFDGMSIVTMPPPSSGGIALLESLGIISAYETAHPEHMLTSLGHNSTEYVYLVAEALQHAFADRARYLGDSDFVEVPVNRILDPTSLTALAAKIDPAATLASEAYGRISLTDDAGTSHFSIIDADGNAVACTETINTTYGSLVVVPQYGIVLNNEMDDFTTAPGKPNAFGLIQSEANAIAPGKKPLSSMTPTIAIRDGKAVFAVGASGGPRIISATLQVLLNLSRFEMSPQKAVAAPRFHHQWTPRELKVEPAFDAGTATELEHKGHRIVRADKLAAAQAAARTDEGLAGGSDPRKGGQSRGW